MKRFNAVFDGKVNHHVVAQTTFYGLIPVFQVEVNGCRRCASCGEIIDHDDAFYRNGRFYCNSEACVRDGFNEERFGEDQIERRDLALAFC